MNTLNIQDSISSLTDCGCEVSQQIEPTNLLETFKRKKLRLTIQLADVNAAITALESHPEINTVLELIAKAR